MFSLATKLRAETLNKKSNIKTKLIQKPNLTVFDMKEFIFELIILLISSSSALEKEEK